MKPYYEQDGVTIYHGDCRDVLLSIEAVDHVITDPPYARDVYLRLSQPNTKLGSGTPGRLKVPLARSNNHHGKTGMKPARLARLAAGDIGSIDEMLEDVACQIARVVKRWAIVFSDAETTWRWKQSLEASGLRYVRTGAWVKPDPMPQMSGDRPCVGFEPCTICHAPGPMRWNGGGGPATWTHFTAKGSMRPDHPCPKPLPLMVDLVAQFTDPGETVLDCYGGSGTTAAAAKLSGRNCILIETNEAHCETAAKRVSDIQPGRLLDYGPRAKDGALFSAEQTA